MSHVKIGFAVVPLYDILPEKRQENQPVEAHGFYAEKENRRAFIFVSDFMDFNLKTVRSLEDAIRPVLPDGTLIHIVTTHNHGGAVCNSLNMPLYEKLAAQCAVKARENSCPAKVRQIRTDMDPNLSMVRRLYIPEVKGSATCFFGIGPETRRNGGPFAAHFVEGLMQGHFHYIGGDAAEQPYRPFPEGDRELFAMEFAAESDGHVLGTILRYAAHAVTCDSAKSNSYSSDFPWFVRQRLKKHFGGFALFLNGLCAEIAPAMTRKSSAEAERLGYALADRAAEQLKTRLFSSLTELEDNLFKISLPIRQEVLQRSVSVPDAMPEGLPERREYFERLHLQGTLPFLLEKYTEGETILRDTVEVTLGLLRLNEERLLFFPGETFSATGKAVQAAFPELHLTTITEHGRTVMYIPTKEEFRRGGYETICELTAENAESVLREKAMAFLSLKT